MSSTVIESSPASRAHAADSREGTRRRTSAPLILAIVLAMALLVLGIVWRVPMMLWDHLDLVPLYAALLDGTLASSALWKIHGGHLHSAAYSILLATTRLSGGQTSADVLASWILLLGYAAVIMGIARECLVSESGAARGALLIVFLALYPGHLSNLQWGWQVAVFLCLLAIAGSVRLLTMDELTPVRNGVAIALAVIASASFAVGVALFPTGFVLVLARSDLSWRARAALGLPWLVALGMLSVIFVQRETSDASLSPAVALYVLNFIGAGIARFSNEAAPYFAMAALVSGGWAIVRLRGDRRSLPWIGFLLVILLGALLAAFARVGTFGADQAFATRYVSFSSLFWIGWVGLMARGSATVKSSRRIDRAGPALFGMVVFLFVVNSVHLMRKAALVADRARIVAATIRDTYPDVPRSVLGEIYFDQPDVARERIDLLHRWNFPPFD